MSSYTAMDNYCTTPALWLSHFTSYPPGDWARRNHSFKSWLHLGLSKQFIKHLLHLHTSSDREFTTRQGSSPLLMPGFHPSHHYCWCLLSQELSLTQCWTQTPSTLPQPKDQITIPKGTLDWETSARKFCFPVSLNEERLLVSLEQLAVGDDDRVVRVAVRGQSDPRSPNSDRHAADGTTR